MTLRRRLGAAGYAIGLSIICSISGAAQAQQSTTPQADRALTGVLLRSLNRRLPRGTKVYTQSTYTVRQHTATGYVVSVFPQEAAVHSTAKGVDVTLDGNTEHFDNATVERHADAASVIVYPGRTAPLSVAGLSPACVVSANENCRHALAIQRMTKKMQSEMRIVK